MDEKTKALVEAREHMPRGIKRYENRSPDKDEFGLTDAQREYINRYFLNGFNRKEAREYAGITTTLESKPEVVREIDRRRAELQERHAGLREALIEELAALAFARYGDLLTVQEDGTAYVDMRKLTPEQRAAIVEFSTDERKVGRGEDAVEIVKYRVRFHDKVTAISTLARMLGLFNDKMTINVEEDMISALQRGRAQAGEIVDVTPTEEANE